MRDSTRIALAVILAAVIVAVALYLRPTPDRYEVDFTSSEIRRFDTATGELRYCSKGRCDNFDWN